MKKQKYCRTHLILGGARAGKTKFAQNLALKLSKDCQRLPIYIATGQALDPEMEERIRIHKTDIILFRMRMHIIMRILVNN